MTYHGIDNCDRCGKSLEDGRWLSGLCKRCEKKMLNEKKGKSCVQRRVASHW